MILFNYFSKLGKWSTIFILVTFSYLSIHSQTIVSEDFNSCSLPGTWSAVWTDDPTGNMGGSIGPGACGGSFFTYNCTTSATYSLNGDNANFDGCIISMADDDAGAAADGTGVITSAAYDLTAYTNVDLSFDYSFDALSSEFRVEVFDGTIWNTVLTQTTDINASPTIDISPYISNSTQVRFVHDDLVNSFAWGLGFDNFLIEENLPPPPVPTLSEWGLFFLSLLLACLGLVTIRQRQLVLTGMQSRAFKSWNIPFDKKQYLKYLLATGVFTTTLFMTAILAFGYEMTEADIPGSILCIPLGAYLVYLFKEE